MCVCFNSGFLRVYAQQWDCWVIWQFYSQFLKESHTVLDTDCTSFYSHHARGFPTPSPTFDVCRLFDDGPSDRWHHIFYNHSSLHRHVVAYNFWLKLQSKFRVTISPPMLFSRLIWLFPFICLTTEILSSVSLYVQKGPARISDWHCMKLMDLCGDYWHPNYIEFLNPWTHCVLPFC